MTNAQQAILIEAYLSKCEWYPHGQSGQSAKALERMALVVLRPASIAKNGFYTNTAIKLTDEGKKVAEKILKEDKNALVIMKNAYEMLSARRL